MRERESEREREGKRQPKCLIVCGFCCILFPFHSVLISLTSPRVEDSLVSRKISSKMARHVACIGAGFVGEFAIHE